MSILFIFSGIFLLMTLFNFFHFDLSKRLFLGLCSLLIMMSYFIGNIEVGILSFNILSSISFMLIYFYFARSGLNFYDIGLIAILGLIYKMLIEINSDYLLSFSQTLATLMVFVTFFIYFKNVKRGVFVTLNSSFVLLVLSSMTSINNFGYAVINIKFCLDVVIMCVFATIILRCLNILGGDKIRRLYAKEKNYSNAFIANISI